MINNDEIPVKNCSTDHPLEPPCKKNKPDEGPAIKETKNTDLKHFKLEEVLNVRLDSTCIFLQGTFDDQESKAVVILEKPPFNPETIADLLSTCQTQEAELTNDIYKLRQCIPEEKHNGLKTTVIHPATEKHIAKYRRQKAFLVNESPEDYSEITDKFIDMKQKQLSIQWVYNILEHKSEGERIVYEDPDQKTGFILLPDLKWDTRQLENLYIVGIAHTRDIRSLRDLRGSHLPLLRKLQDDGIKAICSKYGLAAQDLRAFVHYLPSYFHFHVHFTNLRYHAAGSETERAHMLATVISNLELMPNYYQNVTLPCTIRQDSELYQLYKDAAKLN